MNSDQELPHEDHHLLDDYADGAPTPSHDYRKANPMKRIIKKSSAAVVHASEDDSQYGLGWLSSSERGGGKRNRFSIGGEMQKEKKRTMGGKTEDDSEVDCDAHQAKKRGKKTEDNEEIQNSDDGDIRLLVENVMAELKIAGEEDAELNMQNKPEINKLKKLPLLTQVLSKKQLQQEFVDHGILTLLKNWLEPLPNGSLPNITIRSSILKILTDYPIELENCDKVKILKKSGLGKMIMLLSISCEETTSNQKLAKDVVDKWSQVIFSLRNRGDEKAAVKKQMNILIGES